MANDSYLERPSRYTLARCIANRPNAFTDTRKDREREERGRPANSLITRRRWRRLASSFRSRRSGVQKKRKARRSVCLSATAIQQRVEDRGSEGVVFSTASQSGRACGGPGRCRENSLSDVRRVNVANTGGSEYNGSLRWATVNAGGCFILFLAFVGILIKRHLCQNHGDSYTFSVRHLPNSSVRDSLSSQCLRKNTLFKFLHVRTVLSEAYMKFCFCSPSELLNVR